MLNNIHFNMALIIKMHRQVMRLLAMQGRRAEAVAQYERLREALLAERGPVVLKSRRRFRLSLVMSSRCWWASAC